MEEQTVRAGLVHELAENPERLRLGQGEALSAENRLQKSTPGLVIPELQESGLKRIVQARR